MLRKNLANIVTSVRFVLTPVLIYFVFTQARVPFFWTAVIIMFTDAIDGTIARLLNQESAFGRKLDSIADFCFYPTFTVGTIILIRLWLYVPVWSILALLLLPFVSTGLIPLFIVRRISFIHLRTWQVTSYAMILFGAVSLLSSVSIYLFYLVLVAEILASIEETAIYIRDGKNTDNKIHSFFDSPKPISQ